MKEHLKFDEWYSLATSYYNHHGNLEVLLKFKTINGYDYDENGYGLGSWLDYIRGKYRENKLTEEQIEKLKAINFRFDFRNKNIGWEKMYNLAVAYYNHHGNARISEKFKTLNGYDYDENGYALGIWLKTNRKSFKDGKMSEERIKKLNAIGINLEKSFSDSEWERMYNLAVVYYNHYGNSEIRVRFKTINGYEYSKSGYSLGNWMNTNRQYYKEGKLSIDKIEKLKKINFRFETNYYDKEWEKMYNLALLYYNNHIDYETIKSQSDYSYDQKTRILHNWYKLNRTKYMEGKLTEEQIEKLKAINFRFELRDNDIEWERMYNLAVSYYNHYGNSEIKGRFRTNNGYDYDGNGYALGAWINTNRQSFKDGKLSEYRIEKLKKINFRFETNLDDIEWKKMYVLAVSYYNHYGNSEVKEKFRTINGYEYDEKGYALGDWMNTNRRNFKSEKLSEYKIELLKKINFRFESNYNDIEWKRMYALAASYYKYYGNLAINSSFKTINGYEYDENGYALGRWIITQRVLLKNNQLTTNRLNKLNQIDFSFQTDGDINGNLNLCNKFGINYEKYSSLINAISYREFFSKIYYLLDNGIDIVDYDDNLHEIFFMNSDELELNYDLTIKELIDYYFHSYMKDLIEDYYKKRILVKK